jgi:hypothetical protein
MNEDQIREMFPSDNSADWNGGIWPPTMLKARWRELYDICLGGVAEHLTDLLEQPTSVDAFLSRVRSEDPFHDFDPGLRRLAELAAKLADQSLRIELELGLGR